MKKINLIILLFVGTIISCSNNENEVIKTNLELLTEKKWTFDNFEYTSSRNNTQNYSKEEFEEIINRLLQSGNISYQFYANKKGEMNLNNEIYEFNWELIDSKLFFDFENDEFDTDYTLNYVTENELNIKQESVLSEPGIEIYVTGNNIFK